MRMFSKRRRKFIAPLTLAVWLFALFVSVVDACGLDQAPGEQGMAKATMAATMAAPMPSDAASPSCEQFCADDFPVQAKIKVVQDPPSLGASLLAVSFISPSLQSSDESIASWLSCPDPPAGIGATILFLRLAL